MRKTYKLYCSYVALIVLLTQSSAHALDLSEKDKQLHLGVCFSATVGTYGVLRAVGWNHKKSLWTGIFLSMAIGVAKEISDPKVDEQDLQADAIGTAVGAMVPIIIHEF